MIIRCDQCKTRFRLDDSKITASGVRVRCSKCKHTFVVRKEAHEEELDIKEISYNPESSTDDAPKQDHYSMGEVTEGTTSEKKSDEIKFPRESVTASGQDLPGVTGDDNTYSVEDDFHLFMAGRSGSGPVSADEEPDEEKKPFQWPDEEEAEVNQEQVVNDSRLVDTFEGLSTETPYRVHLSEKHRGQSREDFPADSGLVEKVCDSDEMDEFSLGIKMDGKTDDEIQAEKDQPFITSKVAVTGVIGESTDLTDVSAVDEGNRELFSFKSGVDSGFTAPHSVDGTEEILPPLSITSRRKGALSLTKVLAGIVSFVLIVLIVGLYFFKEDFVALNIPGFSGFNKLLMTGHWKSGEIEIKNLEGTFVRNNHGGDVFVIRGEVSNLSDKPSSSIRVKGHIYGTKGDILLNRYAYFGKVLSNEQLVGLPVSEIEALSGNQAGSVARDLIMQPGKRVPFQIIFLGVPEGSGEFGAEVVASSTSGP